MPDKRNGKSPLQKGELRSLAEARLKQNTPSNDIEAQSIKSTPEEMLRFVQELELHHVELEMQEEELVKSRIELEDSLSMYSDLYDFAPIGYLTLGRDSLIQQANLTSSRLLGVDRSSLLGMHFKHFVAPEDNKVIDELLETVFSRRVPGYCDVRLVAAAAHPSSVQSDNPVRTVRIEAAVSDTNHACRVVVSDITAQLQADFQAKEMGEHFRLTIDAAQIGTWEWNFQTEEAIINNRCYEIVGYTPEELAPVTKETWVNLIHPDDLSRSTAIAEQHFRGELKQYECECRLKHKQGQWVWVLVRGGLMDRTADGKPSRMLGIQVDITVRKLAEEALQESEERFRKLFQDHSAVMLILDPDTINILDANHAASVFYGWSIDELKQMNLHEIADLPQEVLKSNIEKIAAAKQNEFALRHRCKDGTLRDVEVFSNLITIEGKAILFSIFHDITDRKQAAEESDRLKSAFLANISHEIRTPMNGIIGFSELLKDPLLSGEEQSEYLSLIQQSGNRMLALINDLMAISKIDARELKLQQTETPLNRLMQDLLAFFKLQADKKGLRLTLSKGLSDEASIISIDSLKLNQILTNLIQNALKFTNKGGIDIGYTRNDGTLHFFVIDSGIGIPGENKNRIFDRFHQVDNSLTRNHEGAGLGLSISKALVEMLGGSIKVESVEGAGSSFSFTIPYNPLHLPTADCQLPTSPCILLAEDDAVSTLLIKRNLKGENLTILSAENGWEAVELLQHHPEIKLVLMDLKMPIMNGFEATKLIKQKHPDLPIIAQSAFTSKEEMQKAKEAGCTDFISKPISKSELLEKMHKLLLW